MNKFFSKKPIEVFAERCWSTTWHGLRWTVHVHFEKRLFGFIKWGEICQMAGPYDNKQDAKKEVKRLRHKYNLK